MKTEFLLPVDVFYFFDGLGIRCIGCRPNQRFCDSKSIELKFEDNKMFKTIILHRVVSPTMDDVVIRISSGDFDDKSLDFSCGINYEYFKENARKVLSDFLDSFKKMRLKVGEIHASVKP